MAYTKLNLQTGDTLTQNHLRHIENGIVDVENQHIRTATVTTDQTVVASKAKATVNLTSPQIDGYTPLFSTIKSTSGFYGDVIVTAEQENNRVTIYNAGNSSRTGTVTVLYVFVKQ